MTAAEGSIHLSVAELEALAHSSLAGIGIDPADLETVTQHTVAAELRGSDGLQRIANLAAHYASLGPPRGPVTVRHETETTASVDGANHLGFVVAERATTLAIEKAQAAGIALVTGNEHRYSGALANYVERVARARLVGIAFTVGSPVVAPYGGREARMSTNPIALGFPSAGDPVVVDLATAAVSGVELGRLADEGARLAAGAALDSNGAPTDDPRAALDGGTVLAWGGHRGSALSVAVQLLGLLADIEPMPPRVGGGWAFGIAAVDPSRFLAPALYEQRVSTFSEAIRSTPPAAGFEGVRMPFDRALAVRTERTANGVDVPAGLHARLVELARG
jgi:delta1-piperideine-2-carboxylate reductase